MSKSSLDIEPLALGCFKTLQTIGSCITGFNAKNRVLAGNSDETKAMQADMIQEIQQQLTKPVVLVGMMGAGKSYLGAALSRALDLPFSDTDKIIEDKAGLPVTEIFESFGEAKFRESERNTIQSLIEEGVSVIATGGGALTSEQTLELLRAQSIMIWLNAGPDTLWQRVKKSQTRPLLFTENPKQKLQALLEERKPLYEQAHITLKTGVNSQQQDIDDLIKGLYEFLNKDRV